MEPRFISDSEHLLDPTIIPIRIILETRTIFIRKKVCHIPRTSRFTAADNYYHVITRGNGQQLLFETNDDYQYYLSLLQRYSEETQVKICVYCLMDNHTHLLVHDEELNLSLFMLKLGTTYARYYNRKYDHSGHVFQNRFKSVLIEDERQFMTVCKYILYNPEKAGICNYPIYPWSSYSAYFSQSDTFGFLDQNIIHTLFANEQCFYNFLSTSQEEESNKDNINMEYDKDKTDDFWARQVMANILHIDSGTCLQNLGRHDRDSALRQLKEAGLSCRQISRLTGISRGVIQRS